MSQIDKSTSVTSHVALSDRGGQQTFLWTHIRSFWILNHVTVLLCWRLWYLLRLIEWNLSGGYSVNFLQWLPQWREVGSWGSRWVRKTIFAKYPWGIFKSVLGYCTIETIHASPRKAKEIGVKNGCPRGVKLERMKGWRGQKALKKLFCVHFVFIHKKLFCVHFLVFYL